MIQYHKLLERQLRRHTSGPSVIPYALRPLLQSVDAAYREADDQHTLLQHSMEIVSEEHAERFVRLQSALDEAARTSETSRQALALLQSIIDSTSDGVLVVDRQGQIVLSNRQFAELWRLPMHVLESGNDARVIGWVLGQLEDPSAFEARIRALYDEEEATSFDVIRFKDGRVVERHSVPHRVDGRVTGRLWTFRDVTDRHELERQFQQAQKLDAIGKLAGGIAHDFNNLITVIDAHCEFLGEDLADRPESAEQVSEIRTAARRAAGLTSQLLAFSRKQVLRPAVLDLCQVVTGVQSMVRRLIGEDITVRTLLAPEAVRVMADLGQLEQVLVNLAVNARDAMPSGGVLTFKVDVATIDPDSVAFHGQGRVPGQYAVLTVTDDGGGMSREIADRIFDPFFTTKNLGQGTGLGLSTVYGIVQQSHGHVTVYTELGLGSTFRVYLPVVEAAPQVAPRSFDNVPAASNEIVLLVEDEEALRAATRRLLERHGYRVIEASNGAEALRMIEDPGMAFHLVLTDVVMPHVGGPVLAAHLKASHPSVPVLFMSGYIEDDIVRRGMVTEEVDFLEKPFTTVSLLSAVRRSLVAA
jgi:two-component system cell cycle sensor histidine kinase/response regulator CckA